MEFNGVVELITDAIAARFDDSDWRSLGLKIDRMDNIENHGRLLRSLRWDDPDYKGCVIQVIHSILTESPDLQDTILANTVIKNWIKEEHPEHYSELYSDSNFVNQFNPKKTSPREGVKQAIEDANKLAHESPKSAVDRVHTALHGYLQDLCDTNKITYDKDPSITHLYKKLRSELTVLKDLESQSESIKKVVTSLSSILDALNPIRNHSTAAHPNEKLLGEAEAVLVINTARTIFHYLDSKL